MIGRELVPCTEFIIHIPLYFGTADIEIKSKIEISFNDISRLWNREYTNMCTPQGWHLGRLPSKISAASTISAICFEEIYSALEYRSSIVSNNGATASMRSWMWTGSNHLTLLTWSNWELIMVYSDRVFVIATFGSPKLSWIWSLFGFLIETLHQVFLHPLAGFNMCVPVGHVMSGGFSPSWGSIMSFSLTHVVLGIQWIRSTLSVSEWYTDGEADDSRWRNSSIYWCNMVAICSWNSCRVCAMLTAFSIRRLVDMLEVTWSVCPCISDY